MRDDDRLAGQVVLVTGAGRNLGRHIGIEAARRGAVVGINVRSDEEGAARVVREITDLGGQAVALVADVGDPDAVDRMVAKCQAAVGPVTTVIHSAAYRSRYLAQDMPTSEWRQVMAVTLDAASFLVRATIEQMSKARFGRFVFVGGVTMFSGQPTAYSHVAAAKAGLLGLVRALAREVAPNGVTANIVSPGTIATESRLNVDGDGRSPASGWVGGPVSTMAEVAAPCLFLCEPVAGAINGQAISVDGIERTREDVIRMGS